MLNSSSMFSHSAQFLFTPASLIFNSPTQHQRQHFASPFQHCTILLQLSWAVRHCGAGLQAVSLDHGSVSSNEDLGHQHFESPFHLSDILQYFHGQGGAVGAAFGQSVLIKDPYQATKTFGLTTTSKGNHKGWASARSVSVYIWREFVLFCFHISD